MPIKLYTGKPRQGKTLRMVAELIEEAKKGERPIYHCGIDGIEPGLGTHFPDITRWNDTDENGEYLIPDGSIVYVDEAWKWFGHLHNATNQKTPGHVLAMAEHGHRGLDFVFTTQGPNQLYPFLRTLIGEHTHVCRALGLHAANCFTWPELQDDVKSTSARENSLKELWRYPTDVFHKYKSASIHTVKPSIPKVVWLLPLVIAGALASTYAAIKLLTPAAEPAPLDAAQSGGLPTDAQQPARPAKPLTGEDWLAQFAPRVAHIPASAPAWDGRKPVSEPRLYCVKSGAGFDALGEKRAASCGCITEQGTRWRIDTETCKAIVDAGGTYDPFKRPAREASERQRREERPQSREFGAASQVPGTRSDMPMASYGAFRGEG